ncbi:6484_t:CDS:10 [Ambispora gerdemannii]|uniref:6484_t:CDS:1 n=1 Tax=Ambispora gerdemannii TaxID=144530 RepID=A0A9N8VCW9_9GLOM|nr:6484_t:CDS:10 [Ambispora gerdemannii]
MRRFARRRVSYVITHDQDEHGHLLGVNSLTLDASTVNPDSGKPEGILYTAGRDGVISSWDLHMPFREKREESDSLNQKAETFNTEETDDNFPIGQQLNDFKSWELDSEKLYTTQPSPKSTFRQSFHSHTDWVNDIVLCHNNQTLISASSDRTLKLWHPHKTDNPINVGNHTDYIKALAYAPGPGWVASGGFDRKIAIWDIIECRPSSNEYNQANFLEHEFKPKVAIHEASPKSSVYALACNPSGTVLVSGSPEKIIRVWDPRTGKRIMRFTGHTDNIRAILVSDDGELILSGSSDTTIKLWSLTAQRCINTFTIHSDSVWALFSDHPRLGTFYSGSKDGLVAKTDYSGCAEIRDGECVAICKENASIVKVVALDNKYVWTATSNSNINRWLDVPIHPRRKNFSYVPTSTSNPTSPASPSSPTIPSSAIIKLTSSDTSYGAAAADSEINTVHSIDLVAIEEQPFGDVDSDDPIPIRDYPDSVIPGQHGLIKHCILNSRRHILTVDTSGEVALWDIIECIRIKTFGKRDLDEVSQENNSIESIPNWCKVDTRIGALTIQLDESQCFDAEIYADEIGTQEDPDTREEIKINLGKWVLRYLFANFVQAANKAHEENQIQESLQQQKTSHDSVLQHHHETLQSEPQSPNQLQHISFPPATMQAQFGDVTNMTANANVSMFASSTLNMNLGPVIPNPVATPISSSNAMNTTTTLQSPTTTQFAAFTAGPFTAPATTGGQPDYFSGSHHNSPTSPTETSAMRTPPGTTVVSNMGSVPAAQIIQPPPPALVNQTSNSNGSSNTMMGRLKHSLKLNNGARKLSRSPSADAKSENALSISVGNYPNSRIIPDNKSNTFSQVSEEDGQSKDEDEAEKKINSPTSVHPPSTVSHSPATTVQQQSLVQQTKGNQQPGLINIPTLPAPLGHFDLHESPAINIPSHTTVIISEESPEASTSVDLYRGTMASLGLDYEEIERQAPSWLYDFLIKNKVPYKEPAKISFILRPHEGSELSELSNGNVKLAAPRILRVRKMLIYVIERLEPSPTSTTNNSHNASADEAEREEEKKIRTLKPEMWVELLCQEQVLPPTMTLATIKAHIWKSGGDLVMTYRMRMKNV